MVLNCSVCGETATAGAKHCSFCGSTLQQPQPAAVAMSVSPMTYDQPQVLAVVQPPVIVVTEPQVMAMRPSVDAAREQKAKTALILEIVGGILGFLGIGHLYSGRPLLGIVLCVGWFILHKALIGAGIVSAGLLMLIVLPIIIGVSIYSGRNAERHILSQQ